MKFFLTRFISRTDMRLKTSHHHVCEYVIKGFCCYFYPISLAYLEQDLLF